MNKTNYKTIRKYKCPYCDTRAIRVDLVSHVDKKHQDLIPEGYSSARAVFDFINNKNHGTCMICHKDIYKWNDKINRYYNLCDNPACREHVRKNALERHMKVYNKPTLLNDPEQQEKMLANRKISGSYTFTDGGKVVYTGSYEKKALEFMDKVLQIPSNDIQAPGPVFEYEYDGKIHKWITDIYYIPGNLVIEIKDGGSNPNNRSMKSYREKQVAKEVMITNGGKFNYIRLTDNNFAQLLNIFADMKNEALQSENPKAIVRVNEEVGGLPPQRPPEAYIIPYGMNNAFDNFAYTDSNMDKVLIIDDDGNVIPMIESLFTEKYTVGPYLYYTENDISDKVINIHQDILSESVKFNKYYFVERLVGHNIFKQEDILVEDCFKYYDKQREKKICKLIESGVYRKILSEFSDNNEFKDSNIVDTIGCVYICNSPENGYYAVTPSDFYTASEYFENIESLEMSGVIDLMNDIYKSKHVK